MNKFEYKNLTPFKWFVLENFPFIEADFDALTDWQLYCKLGKEINKIIDSQNVVGSEMEKFSQAFIELQNYVDNYFKNLDVQDEINNKLNEMAESGELTEIIAQYLQLAGLLCFNTVNDLKNATNLANGSFAKTYGFYNISDNGDNIYKIRKITNTDVVDNCKIFALNNFNDLIAEAVINYPINVKKYGVYGDGVHDDYEKIQYIIDNFSKSTLYFPKGNYLISNTLIIKQANDYFVNLNLDKNARIFTNTEINSLLEIGFDKTEGEYDRYNNNGFLWVEGGIFDGTNTQKVINLNSSCQLIRLNKINVINIKNYGLYLTKDTVSGGTSGDVKVTNCYFDGEGSNTTDISTAIYIESYDNEFNNIRIDRCKIGIDCESSGNDFFDVHATMLLHSIEGDSYTTEEYNSTIGFISRGYNRFLQCYADSFGKGFLIKNTAEYGSPLINNCYTYHWGGTNETETYSVYFDNCKPMARICNCNFATPKLGTNHIIYCSLSVETSNINKEDYLELINNEVKNPNTTIPNVDLIYNLQLNKKTGLSMYGKNVKLSSNTLYPLCILKESSSWYKLNVSNDVQLDVDIAVKFVNSNDAEIKVLNTNNSAGKTYRLALANVFTVNNIQYAILGISTRQGESITNALNISNINKCGNNSTYGQIDFSNNATPVPNPSTIATLLF